LYVSPVVTRRSTSSAGIVVWCEWFGARALRLCRLVVCVLGVFEFTFHWVAFLTM